MMEKDEKKVEITGTWIFWIFLIILLSISIFSGIYLESPLLMAICSLISITIFFGGYFLYTWSFHKKKSIDTTFLRNRMLFSIPFFAYIIFYFYRLLSVTGVSDKLSEFEIWAFPAFLIVWALLAKTVLRKQLKLK